jgi:hypothetical protein
MNNFKMNPTEAWSELCKVILGDAPVDAVFSMTNAYGTCMVVRSDGEPMPIYITLSRNGTWDATYCPLGVPPHMKIGT